MMHLQQARNAARSQRSEDAHGHLNEAERIARRIGERNARLLARHYGSFAEWRERMLAATVVGSDARLELGAIVGIGPAIAEELAEFFAEPRNVVLFEWVDGAAPTAEDG